MSMSLERMLHAIPLRVRSLARRGSVESDLDDEMRYHVERQTEMNIASGMLPADARMAALRSFGNVGLLKEQARDTRRVSSLENFFRDIGHAARGIRRRPRFALAVVTVLALGVAGVTFIFSVVSGVLLRPLPFDHPERLVMIWSEPAKLGAALGPQPVGGTFVDDVRGSLSELQYVSALNPTRFNLGDATSPERIDGAEVTGDFFETLGVHPQIGNAFSVAEETPGADHVVVLSAALWRRRFSGDPRIVGQKIVLNGEPYVVAGVAPEGFEFPRAAEVPGQFELPPSTTMWVPKAVPKNGPSTLLMFGRVREGASVAAAQRNLDRVTQALEERRPELRGWMGTHAASLSTEMVGDVRGMLLALLAGVGILLAISCANAAQLFLAHLHERRKELAVRAAIGATAPRIARILMAEAALLTLLAGAIGAGIGIAGIAIVRAIGPARLPRLTEIIVDWRVVAAAVGITIATGLLFGVGPALAASKVDLTDDLRRGGRQGAGVSSRVRRALIAAEVALSVVLVSGAGLLIRSLSAQLGANVGMCAEHAITFEVTLPASEYPEVQGGTFMTHPRGVQFLAASLERIQALPHVKFAAIGSPLPISGSQNITSFIAPDATGKNTDPSHPTVASYTVASAGMFAALGTPLRAGRDFTDADRENGLQVVIINEAMARWLWPNGSAVGRQIHLGSARSQAPLMTVIGVVVDSRRYSLTKDPVPEMYVPYTQRPFPSFSTMSLIVRTESDPAQIVPLIRRAIASVDPAIPVANIRTVDALVSDASANARFASRSMALFGTSALLLAMVGLYGVISHAVQQRRQEFGLRTALGATGRQVVWLVLSDGLRVGVAGIAIGIVASLFATRVLGSMLYRVAALDPTTFAVTTGLLLCATIVACVVPAARAARTDPKLALDDS